MAWVISLASACLLIGALHARRSPERPRQEARAWRRLLAGATLICAATILSQVPVLFASGSSWLGQAGPIVFDAGCVLAAAWIYQGLIHWNRSRTLASDPGDGLNSLSAVLVLVAIGTVAFPDLRVALGAGALQDQSALWAWAVSIVVLGTAASVCGISGLTRDRRMWMVITALVLVAGAETAALLQGEQPRGVQWAWLGVALLIILGARMPGGDGEPRPATDLATIIGALVVLLAGVAILAVDDAIAAEGSVLTVLYAVAGVMGVSARVLRLVQDLSHLAQTRHAAMTDELTGIANRRALIAAIDQALAKERPVSLLLVDLDRFKDINDRYGHAAGDHLLQHIAREFSAMVPAGALLARLGGDEFAVLLVGVSDDDTALLAAAMAGAMPPLEDVPGRVLQTAASVGLAVADLPHVDGGELLRRADTAMYQAKTSGSGVHRYDRALDTAAQERRELMEDLRRALAHHDDDPQIDVFYQPQLSIETGQVMGAEALVRWRHPFRGLLAPDVFVALAERNDLMPALTARVMQEATLQAARWREAGQRLRVSVNLSASCLTEPSLLVLVDAALAGGMPAGDLVLEITETSLMNNTRLALATLHELAGRGVGISIDDYGTGYSSLSYMNDLPATELKIDRSFTLRTVGDPKTTAIVAATVQLGHRLGMRLVAEGVEDESTLIIMGALGCDEAQGYFHSRPLPPDAFLAWILERAEPPAREHQLAGGFDI